ncbi:helix-turn-helix protein [compost metagenome]
MIPKAMTEGNSKTLREWRAFKRLTKAKVAKHLDVHPTTYASMENRPMDVTVREAVILAEIFECKVEEINFFE